MPVNPEIERRDRLFQAAVPLVEKSLSHDQKHVRRVMGYAQLLQEVYGGDLTVLEATAVVHDLGRGQNPTLHGKDSRDLSVQLARLLLGQAGYSPGEVEQILQVVREHDQTEARPTTLEGRIFKDADFLDGFGAMGIVRTAFWTVEAGQGIPEILERLEQRMPQRIASLEFPLSRRIAGREYRFVRLFLSLLREKPLLEEVWDGYYIAFEGISGSGKDTQARLLIEALNRTGRDSILVFEPSPKRGKTLLKDLRRRRDSRELEVFILAADRYVTMREEVFPALGGGKNVVTVRSFLSSQVYQGTGELGEAYIGFLNNFVPDPELVVWLDVEPELAWERIRKRYEKGGIALSKFETIDKLTLHRERYRQLLEDMNNVVRIDGSADVEIVHQQVLKAIESRTLSRTF